MEDVLLLEDAQLGLNGEKCTFELSTSDMIMNYYFNLMAFDRLWDWNASGRA